MKLRPSHIAAHAAVAALENVRRFAPSGALAILPSAFGLEIETPQVSSKDEIEGPIAIINVVGPLMHHEEIDPWCGAAWFDSYDGVKRRVGEALNGPAKCVLLSIDSPGGLVAGCFDTARELRKMADAAGKPIYAYLNGQAASGGYALACTTHRVFAPAAALVGSIGVLETLHDLTRANEKAGVGFRLISSGVRKTDGNPNVALTEEAERTVQDRVDQLAELFFELVAEYRPISVDELRDLEAGQLLGQAAINAGLADALATLDETLAILSDVGSLQDASTGATTSTGPRAGDWEENKHPRRDDGKFGSGGGGGKKEEKKEPSAKPSKHGEAKIRSQKQLLDELPKGKDGKQRYEGFPVESIKKVHEYSGETGLKAVIFRTDRNGREVRTYRYTTEHEQAHADARFAKAVKTAQNIGTVRERAEKDSGSENRKTADSAVIVRLIDSTTIRVGGSKAEERTGSVGATTLRAEHVIQNDDGSVQLKFPGKSGKAWDRRIEGPLAKEIASRVAGKKPEERVFAASASDVNGYLGKISPHKITAKDFRTFHASAMAHQLLAEAPPPPKIPAKQAEAKIKEAVAATAQHLGNTPTVCRQKYINPRVLDAYRNRVTEQAA